MLTLHHLETSRSSRIIWLLEALGIDYELVTHQRNEQRRAPPELKAVHPLGKAPTIVDGDLVLTESATILRYIATRYGEGRFMPAPGTTAAALHDEWLDYAESSLMMPLMFNLMGRMGGGLPDALQRFAGPELDKALDYIAAGVGEGRFLMGDDLTLADMQMSYCMAMAEAGGFLAPRPALAAYWERLQDHPGFRRAVEVGGPLMMIPGR
ncbi:glutathione S-transferase family protein [Sphingomonas solaris]|uniref:glutathione transferase n=1 Tax=Alterirhizorhabdus solaris TaxID=2529389 RepID=A0A558RBC7_9SPHN|nr:glutathione S-transferase family protein [Sphingomonas solaris]TVV76747.1 glutathione S-transferase family protein [Sphingomonas solaris]